MTKENLLICEICDIHAIKLYSASFFNLDTHKHEIKKVCLKCKKNPNRQKVKHDYLGAINYLYSLGVPIENIKNI